MSLLLFFWRWYKMSNHLSTQMGLLNRKMSRLHLHDSTTLALIKAVTIERSLNTSIITNNSLIIWVTTVINGQAWGKEHNGIVHETSAQFTRPDAACVEQNNIPYNYLYLSLTSQTKMNKQPKWGIEDRSTR